MLRTRPTEDAGMRRARRAVAPAAGLAAIVGLVVLTGGAATSSAAGGAFPGQGFLPDNRAWEMVSPPDKNGGDVIGDPTQIQVATDGDAVTFNSFIAFGDAIGTGLITTYMSERDDSSPHGWRTHSLTPPQESLSYLGVFDYRFGTYQGELSANLGKGVFRSASPLTETASVINGSIYLRDNLRDPGSGNYKLLSESNPSVSLEGGSKIALAGTSTDFRHILFETALSLTPDAPDAGGELLLYEWDNGIIRNVGVLPDSEGGDAAPTAQAGRGATNGRYPGRAISDDGSRVYFMVPSGYLQPEGSLYLRTDHVSSVRINASEKAVPDPTQPAEFATSTPDGTKAYFTTSEQLTEDDTNSAPDLYVYDASRPDSDPANLTRLSTDSEPADGTSAQVLGVVGASSDGSYVYFTAEGQLVSGAPPSVSGAAIYLWHDGDVRYVGSFGGDSLGAAAAVGRTNYALLTRSSRMARDGKRLLFVGSDGSQLTGYDHGTTGCGTFGTSACLETYVYDSAANHGDGKLSCVSCNPNAPVATSDGSPFLDVGIAASEVTSVLNRPLADDGRHVFFTSGEALVPEDTNGNFDAYEYDLTDSSVHLLSSGRSAAGSYFVNASPDGSNAFFVTREQLSGWDNDDSYDLYDAKVGGGVPEPVSASAECMGSACQATPSNGIERVKQAIQSAAFTGPGNPSTRHGKARHKRRMRHRHRRAAMQIANGDRGAVR